MGRIVQKRGKRELVPASITFDAKQREQLEEIGEAVYDVPGWSVLVCRTQRMNEICEIVQGSEAVRVETPIEAEVFPDPFVEPGLAGCAEVAGNWE